MNDPLSPYIRVAVYNVLESDHLVKERVIFDYELLYVKEGVAAITVEDRSYIGNVGDVFLFRPRQRHSIHVQTTAQLIQPHVHFDLLYRPNREQIPICFKNLQELSGEEMGFFHKDILDQFYDPFPSFLHLHNPKLFELLLFDLIHEYGNPSAFSEIKLIALFMRLWEHVLNEVTFNFDALHSSKEITTRIKLYIEQNVSAPLSMEELSNVTHFSKSYINRLFRTNYGIAPLRYHTLLRMQKAQSLVRNTNMSISEIADILGFSYPQDFCRVFKKVCNTAPSAYRSMDR